MPGILGIIAKHLHYESTSHIGAMLASMRHESSYRSGTLVQDRLGATFGWVCHPGSFADCMPVWNETRDICLIWTGENFADQTDIEHLRSVGHLFTPGCAEYVVHLYEEYGTKFLNRLNGWFSGVLLDLRESTAVLFNDRYGLGRLYFHETSDAFYFASEAKALLKVLPQLRRLDQKSLGEFLSCGCPLQNRTLFEGISLLPSGSAWVFLPQGKRREECYFHSHVWTDQSPLPASEYYEKLKDVFPRVLRRYFDSEQPLGMSLTGGVDSRMMMAWAPPRVLPTYTFAGIYRDCGDVHLAKKVANICGQSHHVIRVGDEFLAEFPRLAAKTVYVSDGMMDVSGTPDLFVNEIVKTIAPIRLTGNYGGEILRRVVAFKPACLEGSIFCPEIREQIRIAEHVYQNELDAVNPVAFVAFKQVPWHHYARLSVEQSQLTVRSPYLDNDLVSLAFQVPAEHARSNELALRLTADANPKLAAVGTDRGIHYQALPGLSKFQNLFQEFTFRAEYAYDYGMPQGLARIDSLLKPLHLERLFLGRHKFYHFRVWYRDQLSHYVKETLLDRRSLSRPWLEGLRVEQIVKQHLAGVRNYTRELHRLLTLELVYRHLLEMN